MNEFLRCARSAHPPITISCKFKELLKSESEREFLDGQQARKLLQRLGHVYSAKEIDKLLRRCTTKDNSEDPRFTFEDICRLTSAALLFLQEDPIPRPTPATWNELVLAMHTILGALATSVLVFFSLKPTAEAPTPSAAPTIPFLHQLPNSLDSRVTDAVLMVCICGWGGFHVLSLALRGTRKGIAMDCIALACGPHIYGLSTLCDTEVKG